MIFAIILVALLLAACSPMDNTEQENKLECAWTLRQIVFPADTSKAVFDNRGTVLHLYDGDSVMFECQMLQTETALIIQPVSMTNVTLIDTGRGENVYLEDSDPYPLTFVDDTTIVIQQNGLRYTWHREDSIEHEWGKEIRELIRLDLQNNLSREQHNYVLSSKERRQENIIHLVVYSMLAIVIVMLIILWIAIDNRKSKRRLQLQLRQIREEHDKRPQSIRTAIESVENDYFASDDYQLLQQRIATGQRIRKDEWSEIEEKVKRVYPGFCSQLHNLYNMSELEFQVCLLVKLRIAPTDIAAVLSRETSTISTVRSRLYKKVFGKKGGARDWDEFILSIGV